jgi:hypothetical protein
LKFIIGYIIYSLLLVFPLLAQKPLPISSADLQVKGIRIGMDAQKVQEILGDYYDGISVNVDSKSKVIRIYVQDPSLKTTRGLKIGDRSKKALKLYGPPFVKDDVPNWFYFCKGDSDREFILKFHDDTLSEFMFGIFKD